MVVVLEEVFILIILKVFSFRGISIISKYIGDLLVFVLETLVVEVQHRYYSRVREEEPQVRVKDDAILKLADNEIVAAISNTVQGSEGISK